MFKVVCSKGTYIRRLAHDLGVKLGVGGYLHTLCRTQIGDYCLDQAYSLEALLKINRFSDFPIQCSGGESVQLMP
ncbi:hypothetical protein [Cardinium endosymbiont of Dermatophagoides farinae]|uniref:hypothetical protein n=1 Tax=Cardinium endosymbiont of Dermatophagoides farinae TaxID=2597823 RepID=UPI002A4E2628|nr:hypothetical protein [Cardinium endosymbiont of Dermatophagoides farinae]